MTECKKCKTLETLARRMSAALLLTSSDVLNIMSSDSEMRREIKTALDDADAILDLTDLRSCLKVLELEKTQGAIPR